MADLNLLFPDSETQKHYFELEKNTINDLSLDFLAETFSQSSGETALIKRIMIKMPTDRASIEYRQEIYKDLKDRCEICEKFYDVFDDLRFFAMNSRRNLDKKSSIWELLTRFNEIKHYINAVKTIMEIMKENEFSSRGMKKLKDYVENIYSESGFTELEKDLSLVDDDMGRIYSMTLGVNFTENFFPAEVGILSLNSYSFGEKGIIEKFIRYHKQKNPEDKDLRNFTMLTHKKTDSPEDSMLMKNLTTLIEQMLPSQTRSIDKIIKKYTNISGMQLANCADDFLFFLRAAQYEKKLGEEGMLCCIPSFSEEKTVMKDMYNLKLAECIRRKQAEGPVVANDLRFSDGKNILILTGPNRGGKTIITQAVGIAFLMAQQGIFVPAREAEMQIVDGIFTHFPADENSTVSLGRLGEEANRFSRISELSTADSLILMNESFATTSHTESLYIAEDVVRYLCSEGTKTIFNTHMHEIGENAENYSDSDSRTKAVSIVMGKRNTADAFKIRYEKPDGKSYAREIAEKYSITLEQLKKKKEKK